MSINIILQIRELQENSSIEKVLIYRKMFILISSFRISKKVTFDFSYILEVLQAHCVMCIALYF